MPNIHNTELDFPRASQDCLKKTDENYQQISETSPPVERIWIRFAETETFLSSALS
jgi:hypothetical protein